MRTLRYQSRGQEVYLLEEILQKLDYGTLTLVNTYFDLETLSAVKDFQAKNNLVVDGIVGPKTWSVLLQKQQSFFSQNDKFLSEDDLKNFANEYGLELAAVKAVNEIESTGRGFLIDGRPKILFEGHIFWKELKKRGVNPENYRNGKTANILYSSWTKKYYKGGSGEYHRLDEAAGLSEDPRFREAALSSVSWGAFQIMGFHATTLGYPTVEYFVSDMYEHERKHLKAFGLFLQKNQLIQALKDKNWAKFARGYNGTGYKKNKYDEKLAKAFQKYQKY